MSCYLILKLNKPYLLLLAVLWPVLAVAQTQPSTSGYFFPVRPGVTNFLSGTMGELRSTHFHAGIDIKTSGREGLPIYAAQQGTITRIKISTGGYGNCLYMLHPDGNTTVYAHLQKFVPAIANWVRKKQYQK